MFKMYDASMQDFKKRRIVENSKSIQEHEPSGLDAVASAAVLGENLLEPPPNILDTVPGYSALKWKRETCTCNVCMAVKRRFKTLMLRRKKRQSEREANAAQKDQVIQKEESETNGASRDDTSRLEKEVGLNRSQVEVGEFSAGQIDLNSHPNREDMQVDITGLNMSSHLETIANHTVREYMNQNGLRSFNNEVQTGQNSLQTRSNGEGQRYFSDGRCFASIVWNQERRDEVYS
ncbi:B3 domain-containing transcription repressor VAL isoform X5 [Spatholobus suberectus]|nr:B3 domain-containing transcription repressor VAL isoform X5 [Spatholobus suberectus]